ncbi:serine hydrolase [Actinokineospora xionganensis]|uniref:Beta-lactamase n=1 Tax=Actinokineospora xionganensis TaxID=2684470 RepID=A0ABR7L7D7_9PSEU|nr:serine hydrolase [Actinokineospora xionganensis]MBC6448458.1 serine hydrolase [Actinokineospora xionganensis]
MNVTRRSALGLGAVVGATALGVGATTPASASTPATAAQACSKIKSVYDRETTRAAGTWSSFITVTGEATPAVEALADQVVEAYSVNKIAVATAVLDKIDRGLLALDQRVDVTADIVSHDGDGIFGYDGAYPSSVTLGHVLANLLTVSDNTAVRLCGLVVPAAELNEILRAKGFVHTQVKPVANPNRFYLGTTTARETHTMLQRLVDGTLLSATSSAYVLSLLCSLTSFTDGIRLNMSSAERVRVAAKAGWFADGRNEAGIVFDTAGKAAITYALFASGQFSGDAAANADNYSATHPALRARQAIGRTLLDSVPPVSAPTARKFSVPRYHPSNGG